MTAVSMTILCAIPLFINMSKEPWKDKDFMIFSNAVKTCDSDSRYKGNRCVKKFLKMEPQVYRVICGPNK